MKKRFSYLLVFAVIISAIVFTACAFADKNTPQDNAQIEKNEELEKLYSTIYTVADNSKSTAFSDVNASDWYYENVMSMMDLNIINGYNDGTFRPNNTITNAEFTSIIRRFMTSETGEMKDNHWASADMQYALSKNWYDYDEIGIAAYDVPITRQLAVKILMIAMMPDAKEEYYKYMMEIKDFNDISGRYAYLVVRAYTEGVLLGDDSGKFNPMNNLTRAEACAIISRAKGLADLPNVTPALTTPAIHTPPTATVITEGGVSQNGTLQVIGTQLCNRDGVPIQLRGMSSHGIHWFGEFCSYDAIKTTADYGANLFRVAMYTGEGGYLSNPDIKNKVIEAVDASISLDMYTIIDWHILSDGNPKPNTEKAKDFFYEMAVRYKDNPAVIYEICNEPNGNVSWDNDIKPYAEEVIAIIRYASPNAIILVGSGTWSQDLHIAAKNPLNYSNIMYTCHFYAGTHGQWLRDRIDSVMANGMPVFISEWGTSSADGSGGVFLDDAQKWLVFLNERGISWANWSLCDKNETSAALKSGASKNGGWTENDLSESGKFVFRNFK